MVLQTDISSSLKLNELKEKNDAYILLSWAYHIFTGINPTDRSPFSVSDVNDTSLILFQQILQKFFLKVAHTFTIGEQSLFD